MTAKQTMAVELAMIQWTQDLSTGSQCIDEQHKELFRRVDDLLIACRQGEGREKLASLMSFLEEYVIVHFSSEERFMEELAYPLKDEHKREHQIFFRNVAELKRQLEADGPTLLVALAVNRMLVDWLRKHIMQVDRQLGMFMAAAAAKPGR